MGDKLIYIPNDDKKKSIPSVDHNHWLKRLVTNSFELTNQNPVKSTKSL